MENLSSVGYNGAMPKQNESIPDTDLAILCRQIRQETGLTQKEIALLVGVSEDSYANWENGRHKPTGQAVYKLVQIQNKHREDQRKKLSKN